MARLLKDVHPTIAEILAGDHDGILHSFEAAVKHRRKSKVQATGLRVGAFVRVNDVPAASDVAGREGIVSKVNQKTVTVDLACLKCGSAKAAPFTPFDENVAPDPDRVPACEVCWGAPDGIRVSPGLVTVIPSLTRAGVTA